MGALQVTGEFVFKGPREQVWTLFTDETVLQKCTPGCERLERVGPDEFRVGLKIGLAAIKGNYDGTLRFVDRQEPQSMTLLIQSTGSGGFANVSGHMDLVEQGDATRVSYNWNVQVGGPVAMAGQRVLGGVAKWVIDEFFKTAQKELAVRVAI